MSECDTSGSWADDSTLPHAIERLNEHIAPLDQEAARAARDRWNQIAKPIGALGALEDDIVQIAALTGSADVRLHGRAAVVFCADNGVVQQGVSQCGQDVTRAVAEALGNGTSSVCAMAAPHGIRVVPVDVGMQDLSLVPSFENEMAWASGMPLMPAYGENAIPGVLDRAVARCTGDITYGPAMTRDQALRAVQVGVDLAAGLAAEGVRLIASGEMGIGNTTTASALVAALLGLTPEEATGRGAGLSDEALRTKVKVVGRALAANPCSADDPLGALAGLGGFDIAALAGLFIGGALQRVPVIVDGFISAVAAYLATLLCPRSAVALLGSHVSAEPAARAVLDALARRCADQGVKFQPVMNAGMRLGEGTGAVCLVPLLDSALALYGGTTFDGLGIEPYEVDLS